MPLLIFLRWLHGSVHFSAEGGFPERFINHCRHTGLELWNTELRHGMLYAFVCASDYRALRAAARQSGMHLRVCKKKGLPFFLHKQKKHAGLAIGLCLFALFIGVLSTRVWVISIDGNDLTESRVILKKLEEYGVIKGMRSHMLNAHTISTEMIDTMPQLDWIALNLRGSELEILIREHKPDTRAKESDATANIVAANDGQLVLFRTYAGTKALPDGSAIRKDDVLVYGHTKNRDESTSPIRAKGYIVAQTEHNITQKQPLSTGQQRERLGKQYALHLFGLRVPLYFRAWDDACLSLQYFSARGVTLPLGVETRTLPVEALDDATLTPRQAELLALDHLHAQTAALLEYKQVRSFSTERKTKDNAITLSAKYVVWENIGQIKERTSDHSTP
ncbi:MAG: sporulation protein YqfD [Oscillospiraceae bacterium]|jgi:similar to stage IV sporulation protein|nr:sporulation protein YqfD [Oscillospiraceae bacterium]